MEKSQRRVAATGGWWIFHGNVRLHWLSSVNWWYQAGGHCTAKGHPLVAEEEGSGKETAESSFFHWENEWLVRWNMVYFCFTGLFPSTFCWSLASRSAWICLGSFWSLYCLDTRECYVNFIYIYTSCMPPQHRPKWLEFSFPLIFDHLIRWIFVEMMFGDNDMINHPQII